MISPDDQLVLRLAEDLSPSDVEAYAQFAIRNRSPLAREVLRAGGHTAALGRVTALIGGPGAHTQALARLDEAVHDSGVGSLQRDVAAIWAALLLRAGRDDQLATVLEDPEVALSTDDRWMLRTDLLNPHRVAPGADAGLSGDALAAAEVDWLESFNEVHSADGLEPIRLRAAPTGSDTPYRRLEAPVREHVDGDLVTVVMSAYRPDRDLLLAVRGVLDQSWHNLELLVIDDASPAEYDALLEEAAAMDPRVRVVRAPANRGTYEARNLAHTLARGRWLTFQDSDDWTHPRRLEIQIANLESSPRAVANRTWAVRAYADLTMTSVGYDAARLNASSLLYDRRAVARLVGDFDSTRKTGDMELPMRLRAVRPRSVTDLGHPRPLAITQLRADSLSRDDATPGWMRWDRLAYRDGFLEWHRQVTAKRMTAVLAPGDPRPFPLPHASWEPERPANIAPRAWDVVVLGDLRRRSPRAVRTLGVARALAGAGALTAIAHREPPHPLKGKRDSLLLEMVRDIRLGHLGLSNAHAADSCELLVVTEPASVLFLDQAHLQPQRVLVVADDGTPRGWSVAAVDERCRELFGVTPSWGGPTRVHGGPSPVRGAVTDERWCAQDLAAVTSVGDLCVGPPGMWRPLERRHQGSPTRSVVVLGHHLTDGVGRWPATTQGLREAYPASVAIRPRTGAGVGADPTTTMRAELHCLGTMKAARKLLDLELPPPSWLSFAGSGMSVREFLSHLDVWVYLGEWDEAAEVAALEALDAGLPCVLGENAAVSDLQGAVRCVPSERAREAIEELLCSTTGSSSPARRHDEWASMLHQLVPSA